MFTHLIIIQHLISRNTHTMEQIIKSYFINQQVIKNIRKTLHSIRPAGGLCLTRVIECGVAVNSPTLANPCLLNTHAINVRPQACCNILNFFNGKAKKKTFWVATRPPKLPAGENGVTPCEQYSSPGDAPVVCGF